MIKLLRELVEAIKAQTKANNRLADIFEELIDQGQGIVSADSEPPPDGE